MFAAKKVGVQAPLPLSLLDTKCLVNMYRELVPFCPTCKIFSHLVADLNGLTGLLQ